jgi:plasmid maintenance system antidote protein VapI
MDLRALALNLGASHASRHSLLRQRRRLTPRTAEALGERLELTPAQIRAALQHEAAETVLRLARGALRPPA